ncbi:MAG: hypothetical protein IKD64_07160, partial [Lachnospiraceae bacterium]|nr:hypothetical protein [Lachnospiraceae bacterium]
LHLNAVLIFFGQHGMNNQQELQLTEQSREQKPASQKKTAGISSDGVVEIRHPDQERTNFFIM